MAYIKKKVGSYKWPVKIQDPADGGGYEISTMTLEFKRVTQTKIESFKGNRDLLEYVIVGWGDDYQDENGKPVPFSEAEKKALIDMTPFLRAATTAFFESLQGAQEGN